MTTPLLIVGSGNAHKVQEIAKILSDLPIDIRGTEILPSIPDIVESGATFEENAEIKALEFARAAAPLRSIPEFADRPSIWVLSDDSGLCVDALEGRPGVRSARYAQASEVGDGESQGAANNRKLLGELQDVSADRRGARFVCVAAIADVVSPEVSDPVVLARARGECPGWIIDERRGTAGFGYDPLFLVSERDMTFAELPPVEKNRMSHRGRALAALRGKIEELLNR